MKNIYNFLNLIFIFLFLLIANCAFGSEGNHLTESRAYLSSILLLNNSTEFTTPLELYFFDDRGDGLLNKFEIPGGTSGTNYTITLDTSSIINISEFTLALNSPVTYFSNNTTRHSEAGNSSSGSSGNYFLHLKSGINFLSLSQSSDSLGAYQNFITNGFRLKRGVLSSVSMSIESATISGNVSTSSKTFSFLLNFNHTSVKTNMECLKDVSLANPGYLRLQWKYSNFWKDNSSGSILSLMDSRVSGGETITINSSSNSDILNLILTNMETNSDIFKEYNCNL